MLIQRQIRNIKNIVLVIVIIVSLAGGGYLFYLNLNYYRGGSTEESNIAIDQAMLASSTVPSTETDVSWWREINSRSIKVFTEPKIKNLQAHALPLDLNNINPGNPEIFDSIFLNPQNLPNQVNPSSP